MTPPARSGVVGVDLAWGRRAPTGLCAVADDGTVLGSALVVSDDEIVAWMAETCPRPAVVGFDAPIVVDNPAGRRECERLLSRAFSPQHAGCYPSNRSLPAFADGGRARALGRRLGLAVSPARAVAEDRGLAAEVYPHSALVALFRLPVRLAYKAGRGRTVEARRQEMARLVELIGRLESADPPLRARAHPRFCELADAVPAAGRQVDLDRVEDELDAYVCAHVARGLAADLAGCPDPRGGAGRAAGAAPTGGRRVRVLGEWEEGAIVTPVDDRQEALLASATMDRCQGG